MTRREILKIIGSGLLFLTLPESASYSNNNIEEQVRETERRMMIYASKRQLQEVKRVDNIPLDIKKLNNDVLYCFWPTSVSSKDSLIYLNGFESHSGWFAETARSFSEKGVSVYTLDRRGSGINRYLEGGKDKWLGDLDELVELIKKENPDKKIYLSSLCFGARIASVYAIRNPDKVDGLIYFSPGLYTKVEPEDKLTIFFSPDKKVRGPIREDTLFTRLERGLEFIARDTPNEGNEGLRLMYAKGQQFLDGNDLKEEAEKNRETIKVPVLVLLGLKDEVVDLKKTRDFFKKMKDVTIIDYPNSYHALFFEDIPLVPDVLNWMNRK